MAEEQKDLVAVKVAFAGGTDNVALSGEAAFPAGSHYRTFAAASYSDGATVNVLMVEADDGSQFELHRQTVYTTAAGGSIARSTGTLVAGSNGASLVNFAAADLVVMDVFTAAGRMSDLGRIAALEDAQISLASTDHDATHVTSGSDKIRDATAAQDGLMTAAYAGKLDGVESGATADQSDAEIETAYGNQVAVVGQAEVEAGTATTVRRWTAERVKQAIIALAAGIADGALTIAKTAGLQTALDGKAASSHTHAPANITLAASDRLVGRDTASGGAGEELTVGGGVEFTGSGGIQRSALTGAVNASAGSGTTAIANDAVTDAALRNSGALSVIGRSANSTGDPADISASAASGAVLRENGSALGFGTVATAGIADAAVTSAKLRNSSALSVIGRSANSSGVPADISTSGASAAVLRESGSALGFGTIATGGIANDAVTYAKIQNVSATDRLLGRSTAGAGDIEEIVCTLAARNLLDDATAAAMLTTLGALPLAGGTMAGALNFNGQVTQGNLATVDTSSGTLAANQTGRIVVTSGNVTIPTTAGYNVTLIAGGAHTVSFNSTTSAAMAAGDVMSIVVQSSTVIHAVKVPAANKVSFV